MDLILKTALNRNMKKNFDEKIKEWVGAVLDGRAKVIDDFCKVYLASRSEWFIENPERLQRLRLEVQQVHTPNGIKETYTFSMKPGRSKLSSTPNTE